MNKLSVLLLMLMGVTMVFVRDSHADSPEGQPQYAIAIHGGAGSGGEKLSDEQRRVREESLGEALRTGVRVLADGGASLDAVEQVIRILEDDPHFNAGRGAVMNHRGHHELDASIMDGRDKSCGAVAGVTIVKNPIHVARLVMTETRHVLLAGAGADQFAKERKVDLVDQSYFWTQHAADALKRIQAKQANEDHKGTVGCVALDTHGNLAAGTSTGGLTNKRFGRVGDSPIIAAGTYADNASCAVSCTGIGEHFIRHAVAYDVSARMKYCGDSLADAVWQVIHKTLRAGDGGVIAVDRKGMIVVDFNTPGMARGTADSTGRFEVKIGR